MIDLDKTLIYSEPNGPPETASTPFFTVEGTRYRFSDGAAEFIQYISTLPDARISFFSGGPKSRNLEVLNHLRLPNGKSALDVMYVLRSHNDLTTMPGVSKNAPVYERAKKDLRKISANIDNTILVDDHRHYPLPGQEKNAVWLQVEDPSVPESLERNKLAYAAEVLREATEKKEKEGISLVAAVDAITRNASGEIIPWNTVDNLTRFQRGAALFQAQNPNYSGTIPLDTHFAAGSCPQGFHALVTTSLR